jgi:phage terminase large subunit GpA-like protein
MRTKQDYTESLERRNAELATRVEVLEAENEGYQKGGIEQAKDLVKWQRRAQRFEVALTKAREALEYYANHRHILSGGPGTAIDALAAIKEVLGEKK